MRYRFLEALDKIAGTDKKIKRSCESEIWYSLVYIDNKDKTPLLMRDDNTCWWPDTKLRESRIWEIETETIYVWGVCGASDASLLFDEEPKKVVGNGWLYENDVSVVRLMTDNLFPKDKPQKFRLVPVDDE